MVLDYTVDGNVRSPQGNRDDLFAPQNCYRCAGEDEWVAITIRTEANWKALCAILGRDDLQALNDTVARRGAQEEIDSAIGAWTAARTPWDAFTILQQAGIPAAPSSTAQAMIEDAHLGARGFWQAPNHAEVGERAIAGLAWTLTRAPAPAMRAAPLLGEDTMSTLTHVLDLDSQELAKLDESGVLQ
jgi:crotonobetainyl-CoA:carnitine CoA-transferase CaiB-like acyl-CoA transferase